MTLRATPALKAHAERARSVIPGTQAADPRTNALAC